MCSDGKGGGYTRLGILGDVLEATGGDGVMGCCTGGGREKRGIIFGPKPLERL